MRVSNRRGEYEAKRTGEVDGSSQPSKLAMHFPMRGAQVTPHGPPPVTTYTLRQDGSFPIVGIPSGATGPYNFVQYLVGATAPLVIGRGA